MSHMSRLEIFAAIITGFALAPVLWLFIIAVMLLGG